MHLIGDNPAILLGGRQDFSLGCQGHILFDAGEEALCIRRGSLPPHFI